MRPHRRPHFASPELMNWSMMTCAPFTKSPNCAFPDHEAVRARWSSKPYSKPSTASSDSSESITREARLARRQVLAAGCTSRRAAGRCQHGVTMEERAAAAVLADRGALRSLPSSSVAYASVSAKPQSSGSWPAAILSRSSHDALRPAGAA